MLGDAIAYKNDQLQIEFMFSEMKNVRFNINETIVVIDKSEKKMAKGTSMDLFLLIMVNLYFFTRTLAPVCVSNPCIQMM